MKIVWSKRAMRRWQQTAEYIRQEWGESAVQKFLRKSMDVQETLKQSPEMGQEEPLLAGKKYTYRYVLIARQNKLIYIVKGDTIHIAALWDTRREPKKLINSIK